jgi:hypothetical protein
VIDKPPKAVCPNPLHRKSRVAAWGKIERSTGTFRSYRCHPAVGKPHRFTVPLDAGSRRRHSAGGGPACPDHPGSAVVRRGTYREPPLPPRQLYHATGGRPGDLEAAIAECHEALAGRLGNTDRAWDHLAVVKAMLNGRLARALVPPTARHVAQNPVRPSRPLRFLRVRV